MEDHGGDGVEGSARRLGDAAGGYVRGVEYAWWGHIMEEGAVVEGNVEDVYGEGRTRRLDATETMW